MKITQKLWGCDNGREIYLFELDNEGGMRAVVSNYGGVLQSLYVKDGQGNELDTVLGYDAFEEYKNSETFFGAMVGPVADRLAGGSCELGGRRVQLPLNAGPDCMHSGSGGFHAHVWQWEILEDGIAFFDELHEAETCFPGPLRVRLSYRITAQRTLRLEYSAKSEIETAVSFTNHSYFNLDGGSGHCGEQIIQVFASGYAETERDVEPICTGRVIPVQGTPYDLRSGRVLGDVLQEKHFREIRTGGGIDHFFLVDGQGMREHVRLESKKSGLVLNCRSDAPGVLVYTANGLENEPGKQGSVYGCNWAVCMETERFPNGINMPEHRHGVILNPGESFESATEFVFSVGE